MPEIAFFSFFFFSVGLCYTKDEKKETQFLVSGRAAKQKTKNKYIYIYVYIYIKQKIKKAKTKTVVLQWPGSGVWGGASSPDPGLGCFLAENGAAHHTTTCSGAGAGAPLAVQSDWEV